MDTTHQGHVPILYQVLAGNVADITRPLPHMEALKAFLGRPELRDKRLHPLLVSDCKMIPSEAVLACHSYELYYLGPVADTLATEKVLRSVSAAELQRHLLDYRPKRVKADDASFVPYAGVWRTLTFDHGGKSVTDRALVVWSAGKNRLDQQKRKSCLKRLLSGLETIQKHLNSRRYKRRSYVEERIHKLCQGNPTKELVDVHLEGEEGNLTFHFRLNPQRLQAAQALDGRYVLATNAKHLEANQALTLFKGQDGAEKRFRTVNPLRVRPLFVRTDQRIEGLIFISLLSLFIQALLEHLAHQRGLTLTFNRLLRPFETLQAVDVRWQDGSCQRQATEPTADQTQILRALGWPMPATYASLSSC